MVREGGEGGWWWWQEEGERGEIVGGWRGVGVIRERGG